MISCIVLLQVHVVPFSGYFVRTTCWMVTEVSFMLLYFSYFYDISVHCVCLLCPFPYFHVI